MNLQFKRKNKYIYIVILFALLLPLLHILFVPTISAQNSSSQNSDQLWPIQSVDTLKTSRDKARIELYNKEFDNEIEKEVKAIKHLGANYITIDTPYDEEFRPYLERWIRISRENGLKIWFRGNWSNWEGWFGYQKNLSPEEHIIKTRNFITSNPHLFNDGDIFESCPECENSEYWLPTVVNKEFNEFNRNQISSNRDAFKKINKKVITNINIIALDQTVNSPALMEEKFKNFAEKKNKVLISNFATPIPLNSSMNSESEHAKLVESIFEEFYKAKDTIIGINYQASTGGATAILNDDLTPRESYDIVRNYYTPGIVKGKVTNTLGEPLVDVIVETDSDNVIQSKRTDKYGNYRLSVPPRSIKLLAGAGEYTIEDKFVDIPNSGDEKTVNFAIEPLYPDIIYQTRRFMNSLFK